MSASMAPKQNIVLANFKNFSLFSLIPKQYYRYRTDIIRVSMHRKWHNIQQSDSIKRTVFLNSSWWDRNCYLWPRKFLFFWSEKQTFYNYNYYIMIINRYRSGYQVFSPKHQRMFVFAHNAPCINLTQASLRSLWEYIPLLEISLNDFCLFVF